MTAENTANPATLNTIVLIHGLWMTPLSWEHWIDRYEVRGFRVLAPAWPGMDGDIDELRRDPSGIEHLGIQEIVGHYAASIRELDRPPIIMGHSFGGAFAQILLDRGLGAAGVAIDSAAVKGVLTLPWSTLKSAFPVLKSPANNNRAVALSLEEFRYAFTNTLTEESQAAYERYAVPGGSSSRLLWRTSTHAPQLVSTSTTTTAHLCCSLPGGRTTSAPLRLTGPTPSVISSPRQSRCTRSFLSARISRWARRAGSRSPTTPSPGPSRTLLCTRYGGEQR